MKLNLNIEEIELGKVCVSTILSDDKIEEVRSILNDNGFELIDDKKSKLIDSIKTLIIEKIHHSDAVLESVNSSDYISKELGYDYSYLSNLFYTYFSGSNAPAHIVIHSLSLWAATFFLVPKLCLMRQVGKKKILSHSQNVDLSIHLYP